VGFFHRVWTHIHRLSSMSWSVCSLWRGTTLRAFCLLAPWQIYEILYLLLGMQECRFITPCQGAGLSMADGALTHSSVL
jgi:hypothetical protein